MGNVFQWIIYANGALFIVALLAMFLEFICNTRKKLR